jgi:glucokinase
MIGVDIGGTNLLVGIIEDGKVLKRSHQPIVKGSNFEAVVSQTCSSIVALAGDAFSSVGISVAGSVDSKRGYVLRAQNLDWNNVPLAEAISKKLSCPVVIENDVTAAAWGEYIYGGGVGSNSIFAVWIGTGIGGGLILNGKIWRGPLGTAGEFGMGISEQNPSETHRVLEEYASRSGLQRILDNPQLNTEAIVQGYRKNDKITEAVNNGAQRIGTSIANVITLLSLDKVILGGGLVEALGDRYIEVIRQQFLADVFPAHCRQCELSITMLGPDAGLLGAAALATS